MNLDFSDEQKFLKEEAKKFLTNEEALKKQEMLWKMMMLILIMIYGKK